MSNHAHLLVYCEDINEISKFMHKTNTSFAKLYNNLNERVGYVFRDRYYTQTIENQNHLFNCISYIHNNPVKAGIVNCCSKYKYSSYMEYLYERKIINSESIKLVFGQDKNYMKIFQKMHNITYDDEIMDIDKDETKNPVPNVSKKVVQKYKKSLQLLENKSIINIS